MKVKRELLKEGLSLVQEKKFQEARVLASYLKLLRAVFQIGA